MSRPLLEVIVLHAPSSSTPDPRIEALRQAFDSGRGATAQLAGAATTDPWSSVRFSVFSQGKAFDDALTGGSFGPRALFVLLANDRMTEEDDWKAPLNILASVLPKKPGQGQRDALCFASSEEVPAKLPAKLGERQFLESGALGERRLRPHTLALLALHRSRMLLGANPSPEPLKLFLSHAKEDGLFLAHALRALIKEVRELGKWYDADDLLSGEDWSAALEASASQSVFIAIRTTAYESRSACVDEFQAALAGGVPILVVDALAGPAITPSALPFAAMPTVRISDGNTHRVLVAALREHLRLLLLETIIAEQTPAFPKNAWRVWPRLPTLDALQSRAAAVKTPEYWLLPQTALPTREFQAARATLAALKSTLELMSVESFLSLAPSLPTVAAAAPAPVVPVPPPTQPGN